jgi:hypothetical protein
LIEGESGRDLHDGGPGRDCFDATENDRRGGDIVLGGPGVDDVEADSGDIIRSAGRAARCIHPRPE